MATGQSHPVLRFIRRLAAPRQSGETADTRLLQRFLAHHDEAAVAELVRRHGPMVLGVCRRILRDSHDAEDAFQATFLVLLRKAAQIRPPSMVANWLHGVAYRAALKARAVREQRRRRERPVATLPEPAALPPESWDDVRRL